MEQPESRPDPSDKEFRSMGHPFKLISRILANKPGDQDTVFLGKRFKPIADKEVSIAASPPFPPRPSGTAPEAGPSTEDLEEQAKVSAWVEGLLKNGKRLAEVEEENRVLTRTIARLQGENDQLRASSK